MPSITYDSPWAAAKAMADCLSEPGNKYTARPWNLHQPQSTEWWVLPADHAKGGTSFPYGKYAFWNDGSVMRAGFYIEKGIHSKYGGIYPSLHKRGLLLQDDWSWFRFIGDMESGEWESRLDNIDEPIRIGLSASLVTDPSDREASAPLAQPIQFQYHAGFIELLDPEAVPGHLAMFSDVRSVRSLYEALTSVEVDACWIDLFVSLAFAREAAGYDAEDVYQRYLRHFRAWV